MLADAVHSLSDFITDIVVIVFVRIAGKPEDKKVTITAMANTKPWLRPSSGCYFCVGFGIFLEWGFVRILFAGRTVRISRCSGIGGSTYRCRSFQREILYQYTVISGQEVELWGCLIANAL